MWSITTTLLIISTCMCVFIWEKYALFLIPIRTLLLRNPSWVSIVGMVDICAIIVKINQSDIYVLWVFLYIWVHFLLELNTYPTSVSRVKDFVHSLVPSNEPCNFCTDNERTVSLPCHRNHSGCVDCLIAWMSTVPTCPYCRKQCL